MTPLEDRVRDAIAAKAAEVPPDAVPPLRLPARAGRARAGRARAGRAWVTPLAAAAGVAAALALVFALTGVIDPSRSTGARPAGLGALPRYYVALNFTGGGRCCQPGQPYSPKTQAVVRATASGRALAVIRPPRPYATFAGITAARDDRTFVVAAQKAARYPVMLDATPETTFFVLRINPASSKPAERARLTPVPIPAAPAGTRVWDFALSPDGTRLAVVTSAAKVPHLSVVNVATGATRTWSPGGIGTNLANGVNQNSLSWAADNRSLALVYWGERGRGGIRVLDTAAPGSSLVSNSRLIVGQPISGDAYWIQAQLTPDAHAVIANRDRFRRGLSQQLVEFSAGTGEVVRVLSEITRLYGNDEQVDWMSPSGDMLVVTDAVPAHDHSRASFADVDAGMLTGGHYTPLPWSENTFSAAW